MEQQLIQFSKNPETRFAHTGKIAPEHVIDMDLSLSR
jgi:hypothetical protein